jgi:hypothetical protein
MRGVFETVQMSLLMVGHTHKDIDANFSKVSVRIRHREIATLFGLMVETWESKSCRLQEFCKAICKGSDGTVEADPIPLSATSK